MGETLTWFQGEADGTFLNGSVIDSGLPFWAVAVANLTGGPLPDIVATTGSNDSLVGRYDSALNGTRHVLATDAADRNTGRSVHAVDLDADGTLDIVFPDLRKGVMALFGGPDGSFGGETVLLDERGIATTAVVSVAPADLDGDGLVDLVLNFLSTRRGDVTALRNLGSDSGPGAAPSFEEVIVTSEARGALSSVVADFDSDGILDIATVCRIDNRLVWHKGNGDGTFTRPESRRRPHGRASAGGR